MADHKLILDDARKHLAFLIQPFRWRMVPRVLEKGKSQEAYTGLPSIAEQSEMSPDKTE